MQTDNVPIGYTDRTNAQGYSHQQPYPQCQCAEHIDHDKHQDKNKQ